MDRKHLYQLYTKHERSAYFVPQVEPRLRLYIHKYLPDGSSTDQVIEQARILVEAVRELPVQWQDCTDTDEQKKQKEFIIQLRKQKNQSDSMTALLGYTLFAKKKVRLDKDLKNLQRYFPETNFDDICQFSLIVISRPTKFLKNFRAEPDWYESLCKYAHNKFPKSLTDECRRVAGNIFQRTNLGVLSRTFPRTIATIVAEQFKRDGDYFNRLILLHQCFQELVKTEKITPNEPKSARKVKEFITNEPKPEHYDALLARYRERKTEQHLDIADRAEVTELLEDLSNSVRNYYQPTGGAESLDQVLYPGGNATSDVTLGAMQEAPMTSISSEASEIQTLALDLLRQNSLSYTGVNLRLGILAEPDLELEKVRLMDLKLFLLNGLDLNQTKVGEEVDLLQYEICREVKKEIARLAKELYFRYEKIPPVKKISAEILDRYMNYIEPLCEDYYAELAIDLLERTIASTTGGSIVDEFIHRIETRWQFRFKPEGGGLAQVYAFVRQQQHHQNWDDESKIDKDLRLKKKD
jgi:hypothetical protein